jgi:hypothetical protein
MQNSVYYFTAAQTPSISGVYGGIESRTRFYVVLVNAILPASSVKNLRIKTLFYGKGT